jgi:predicted methyltransferase
MIRTGYMTQDYVIALATRAGFRLAAQSELNANPRDTKDHAEGVWSLPPTRRGFFGGDRYLAIGESDRMTLRFTRP